MVTIASKFNPIYLDEKLLMSSDDMYSYADDSAPKKHTRVGNVLRGIGAAAKWIGGEIVKAERWVVKESKVIAKGVKTTEKKIASKVKALIHHKKKLGHATDDMSTATDTPKGLKTSEDSFLKPLTPLTSQQIATLPKKDAIQAANGEVFDKKEAKGKQITETTDQNGTKTVGVEHTPDEVVAQKDENGNYQYYAKEDADDDKMSTTTKVLIGVGGAAFLGVIIWLAVRKKK